MDTALYAALLHQFQADLTWGFGTAVMVCFLGRIRL